ncbi:hypothetical protein [Priestia sp. P5]|nr:hypothetical protein [Priestia sp. P5]MDG0062284.1 hypothetical protein [Priestia sp. P5]
MKEAYRLSLRTQYAHLKVGSNSLVAITNKAKGYPFAFDINTIYLHIVG